jgi:SAM-dependent methyltransferase
MSFLHLLKKTYEGQSAARAYMNQAMKSFSIRGKTLDVGGARNPDYFSYMAVAPGTTVDVIDGVSHPVDFEKDPLPYRAGAYDTVVFCNVLEHIFNHAFILSEIHRVLKDGGQLVGFVPFLIHFHPDPHDYFRYTEETLGRLLVEGGFKDVVVTPVGKGPFMVGCNTVIQGLPGILRPLWFTLCYVFDVLFEIHSAGTTRRFPLGYSFSARR